MNRLQSDLIRKLLHAQATQRLARALARLKPADVADLFGSLSPGETIALVDVLFANNRAASTLKELPSEYLPQVLPHLSNARLAAMIEHLQADDGATFVLALNAERRPEVLELLPRAVLGAVQCVLDWPEDSAGRIMDIEFLSLDASTSVEDTIAKIRSAEDRSERLLHLYVVDDGGHLVGVVPPRRLVVAQAERTLGEIMVQDPVSVSVLADREEAAHIVARHNLLALPVINDLHHIVGVITVDDVIDVIQEEATEDMYRLAGLNEEDRVFSTPVESVSRRLPWNFLNLLTAFMAAAVVGLFEDTIVQVVALATFMPVVAGMSGNTGIQALTVVTRGIALGEIQFSTGIRAVLKEVFVGLAIGVLMGTIVGLVAWAWKGIPMLGVVLVLAMVCNMTLAGLMGAAIPLILKSLGQDPALGGGILLTAFTDSIGFLVFLGLGALFIPMLV